MAEVKQPQQNANSLEADNINLNRIERQWLKHCIKTQRAALVRSRLKEMEGSDIHRLRRT